MKSTVILAAYALSLAVSANAAKIVSTSSFCSTNVGTLLDPAGCTLAGSPNGSAAATSSAEFSTSGNSLTVNLAGFASTAATLSLTGQPIVTTASASSSVSIDLETSGPVRAGFVLATGSYSDSTSPGLTSSTVQYLLTSSGGPSTGLSCAAGGAHGNGGGGCITPIGLHPIALGTDLQFSGSFTADASAGNGPFTGSAGGGLSFVYQFYEADGTTPVAITVGAPEPASVLLLMVGMTLTGGKLLRRTR